MKTTKSKKEQKKSDQQDTVVVKSLMSDKEVKIPARYKGTCLDPSTERYWSM